MREELKVYYKNNFLPSEEKPHRLRYFLESIIFYSFCFAMVPVFYNLSAKKLFLIESQEYIPFSNIERFVIIPLCTFYVLMLAIWAAINGKSFICWVRNSNLKNSLVCVGIFCVYGVLGGVEVLRCASLIYSFFLIFMMMFFFQNKSQIELLAKTYVCSSGLYIFSHFISILFTMYSALGYKYYHAYRTLFFFEIYQAYVSYSAILMNFAALLTFYCLVSRRKLIIPAMLLIILSLLIAGMGGRRAAFVDICVLIFTVGYYLYAKCTTRTLRINLIKVIIGFIVIISTVAILLSTGLQDRPLYPAMLWNERSAVYIEFLNKFINADLEDILLGSGGPWGWIGNMVLQQLYTLGIIGLLLYMLCVAYAGRALIRWLFKSMNFDSEAIFVVKCWLFYMGVSLLIGNIINMNLQLPYYMVNYTLILISGVVLIGERAHSVFASEKL